MLYVKVILFGNFELYVLRNIFIYKYIVNIIMKNMLFLEFGIFDY